MNPEYFKVHLAPSNVRMIAWEELLKYLRRFVDIDNKDILDAGCGRGELLSCLAQIARVTGVDLVIDPRLEESGYEVIQGSIISFPASNRNFDIVFASNLLEHLEFEQVKIALLKFREVLTMNGHLVILQPNFRFSFRHYFDDYTHKTIFTEKSLSRLLEANGFSIIRVWPKLLPYSVESVSKNVPQFIVRLAVKVYLKSWLRPRAGQMLIIARKI
jgi:2-polyprenyl-3-methyl-5-hydroxy-6-metoxy-1,4-benzoquinol methylase